MNEEKIKQWIQKNCEEQPDIDIVQPANPFLESAGEDMRKRLLLTEVEGKLKCFLPEFTIPICKYHIEKRNNAKRYGYDGFVFRQDRQGKEYFRQVGMEDLGHKDSVKADAGAIKDMMEMLGIVNAREYKIVLGDKSLFAPIVDSLGIPEGLAQRLQRNFGEPKLLERQIEMLSGEPSPISMEKNVKEIIEDEKKLEEYIALKFEEAGLSPRTGRTPSDIATRLREKVSAAQFRLPEADAKMLRRFLEIKVPLENAEESLRKIEKEEKIEFGEAINNFCQRINALKKEKVEMEKCMYQSAFGRKIDYYTGVLFEAHNNNITLAGGGRYDKLCTWLGAKTTIPAVGFSLAMDRIGEG